MTTPFALVCPCGFRSHDPEVFLDHCLVTQHLGLPVDAEGGDVAELLAMFRTVQATASDTARPLPPQASVRRLTRDDILHDDELSDEAKRAILTGFDALQKLETGDE